MLNLTKEQLSELLTYWKEMLLLHNWTITVNISRASEMELDCVAGEVEYQYVNRTAVIRLLDSAEYGERIIEQDQEKTLVHELLHCKFAVIDSEDEITQRVQHQLLNDLSLTLVNTRRNNKTSSVNTLPTQK